MPFSKKDFEIPFERDVLVRGSILGFNNVYPAIKTTEKIKNFTSIISSDASIFDNYVEVLRTFYSVIENTEQLDWKILKAAFDIYMKILSVLKNTLRKHFSRDSNTEEDRSNFLAFTKIYIYFLSEFIQALDRKFASNGVPSVKKAKKGPVSGSEYLVEQWQRKKIELLYFIDAFLELPLPNLWQPPLPEEPFVSLIGNICYNNMISLHTLKDQGIRTTMFRILGTLIKRYNHSNSFIIQLPQAIITNDSATTFIVNGLSQLYNEFELHSVVSNIMKELAREVERETSNDSYIIKSSTNFLTELAAVLPKPMLKSINHLDGFGGNDVPAVRMCYLSILGEILQRVLCFDGVQPDLLLLRQEYLEEIINRIRDLSIAVRARSLQIMTKLLKENSIPLRLDFAILAQAFGRLSDKAVLVRKSAIVYFKLFITQKVSTNKMFRQTIESLEHEIELANDGIRIIDKEIEAVQAQSQQFESWIEKEPLIIEFLNNVFSEETGICEYLPMSETVMPPERELFSGLKENVNQNKFDEVLRICLLLESVSESFIKVREKFPLSHLPKHFLLCIKNVYFADLDNNISPVVKKLNKKRDDNEVCKSELESAIQILKLYIMTFPIIETLLISKTLTDVQEAVEFFTLAYQNFHPDIATKAVLEMLFTISYGFTDKKDIIFKAYTSMFFCSQDSRTERQRSISIVKKLCLVVKYMTIGHYVGFEQIMEHWLQNNHFNSDMIQVLWERFSKKHNDATKEDTHLCLQLLIVCTKYKPSVAHTNLSYIETYALKEVAFNDILVANGVMNLLEAMWTSKNYISESSKVRAKRITPDSSLVNLIVELIVHFFDNPKIKIYNKFIKSAVQLLYVCTDTPNKVMEEILRQLWPKMCPQDVEVNKEGSIPTIAVSTYIIARFVSLMGEIGLNHLIYLDTTVYNELRRRKAEVEEDNRTVKAKQRSIEKLSDRMSVISIQSAASARKLHDREANTTKDEEVDNEEDIERHKYVADVDEESELINQICESGLLNLNAKTMLPQGFKLIVHICTKPAEYDDEHLFSVSCLALTKLMMISSTVCRDHMKLIISILTSTKNTEICNNLIIALSDIAVRFPNVFAPWSQHVFSKLHDKDPSIRCIVLKVLAQLLAQRLIRPKGNIAEIALCLVDPDASIKRIATTFFTELAKQHNEIYNAIPEILSKLITNKDLEETKFKHIMSFLHNLIQKDRQMESLVEKLCLRLQVCTEERQWRELAYCLSILNVSVKSLKMLADNSNCYKDKFHCPKVKEYIKSIVDKALKNPKNDIKQAAADLRDKIESDTRNTEITEDSNAKVFKKPLPPRPRKGRIPSDDDDSSSTSDSGDSSDEGPTNSARQQRVPAKTPAKPPPRTPLVETAVVNRSTRSTRSNASKIIDSPSEDSSDAENFETKRVKRTSARGKK